MSTWAWRTWSPNSSSLRRCVSQSSHRHECTDEDTALFLSDDEDVGVTKGDGHVADDTDDDDTDDVDVTDDVTTHLDTEDDGDDEDDGVVAAAGHGIALSFGTGELAATLACGP